MLLKHCIAAIGVYLISFTGSCQSWTQLSDFPGYERDDGVAFILNDGKAYCGTGLQVGWALTKDFYSLDLATDTWAPIASMPAGQERQYAVAFSNGSNGYVFGGEAGGIDLNDIWMYSPITNSWTAYTSKPGNGVRGASVFWNGAAHVFIMGGAFSATGALSEIWVYNMLNDTWTQKNNMPFTCWRACSAFANLKGYLLFGRDVNGRFRKELFEYDPALDTWTQISTFPGPGRAYATMQNINNDLVVFGGLDSLNNYYNDVWKYSIGSNTWTQLTSLPGVGRKGGIGFTNFTNTNFYYTCGIDQGNTRLKQTWKATQFVGINELEEKAGLRIFPNPSSEKITVKLPKNYLNNYEIVDATGRVLLSGDLKGNHQINVSSLSQGIYFLVCGTYSSKLIIQ